MSRTPAGQPADNERADLWDAGADERERLADERERLSDEREQLADERDRLADEHERLADQRFVAWQDARGAAALDGELVRAEAESNLERAEARVQRAIAERERARAAVERPEGAARRLEAEDARRDAAGDATTLTDEDLSWAQERRAFVATERDRLAYERDTAQAARDELADRRERGADERDHDTQRRERDAVHRDAAERQRAGSGLRNGSRRAQDDLAHVRATARRQRELAARMRERAANERVDANRQIVAGSLVPDAIGAGLSAEFTELARQLFSSQDLAEITNRVLAFVLESVPGCVTAGVAFFAGGRPTLHVTTDTVAERLDTYQFDTRDGPTADAYDSAAPVHVATFDDVPQWSPLAAVAEELGVASLVAYGLSVQRADGWMPLGVLTMYSETPEVFTDEHRDLGSILAAYLAVAAAFDRDRNDLTRREAALHRALSSRDVIGQAKGILMERRHISAGDAFDILRRTSQRLNLRLRELADRMAETGELPG
jgi:hypothetical protein